MPSAGREFAKALHRVRRRRPGCIPLVEKGVNLGIDHRETLQQLDCASFKARAASNELGERGECEFYSSPDDSTKRGKNEIGSHYKPPCDMLLSKPIIRHKSCDIMLYFKE